VAGGGLLGLEAAYALSKVGLSVTLLERGNWLLRRQLDARAAQLLQSYLEGLGLRFLLKASATRLEIDNGRLACVVLNDRRDVKAELLLMAAGIVPSIELARKAGLDVAKGVVVDDYLRTSDAAIFAVGDVAENRGAVLGPVAHGCRAGGGRRGECSGWRPSLSSHRADDHAEVVGADMLSCGRIEAQDGDDEPITHEDEGAKTYMKLVIRRVCCNHPKVLGSASSPLKAYKNYPHGMITTQPSTITADLVVADTSEQDRERDRRLG